MTYRADGLMLGRHFRSRSEIEDRRRSSSIHEERVSAIIDEISYVLNDWTPTGFMVAPYEGRYDVGASIHVTLVIPTDGKEVRFVAKAKVVRKDERLKQLAAVFIGPDAEISKRLTELAVAKHYDSRGRAM